VVKADPAVAAEGWVVNTSFYAAAGLTVHELLSVPTRRSSDLAERVKLNAWSMRRPLPVMTPAPAPVPMSYDVVPCKVPIPVLIATVTVFDAPIPTGERLP